MLHARPEVLRPLEEQRGPDQCTVLQHRRYRPVGRHAAVVVSTGDFDCSWDWRVLHSGDVESRVLMSGAV